MKLSLNWLKDYIDPRLSVDDLVHKLTMAGLEVEAIDHPGKDTVLELEITPNRPDCLNILGLAREISAITKKRLNLPKVPASFKGGVKTSLKIKIEDNRSCATYVGTLIQDVRIAPSSGDLQEKLSAIGIKAINNAVDVTNFVLMEMGQPLHAFDYDKVSGGAIIVRRAKAGERIVTLDGIERKLDPSILVIADAQKPIAIAGIMGGKDTEITSQTKNILLESAHFDLGMIRSATRTLGLRSDSSYRFERNVDIQGVEAGANRATDLILKATGGKCAARVHAGLKPKQKTVTVKVTLQEIENLLGTSISAATLKATLERLGLSAQVKGQTCTAKIPSFRGDLKQSVDLIEEVARTIGFDQLPSKLPLIKATNIQVDGRPRRVKNDIRGILTAGGLNEAVTFSMISVKALSKCQLNHLPFVKVFNPMSQEQEIMRPALLPSLMAVAVTNINRGQKDVCIFEIGKRYFADRECTTLGILLTGRRHGNWKIQRKDSVDYFDLKGYCAEIYKHFNLEVSFERAEGPSFDPSSATVVKFNGKDMGCLGQLDPAVTQQWDIKHQAVYFAEIDLEGLFGLKPKVVKYHAISEFPSIVRDVSLAVDKHVHYAQVEAICRESSGQILKSIEFIEQYTGDKIASDKKALVFSLTYQDPHRTLREEDVTAAYDRMIEELKTTIGAVRR